MCIKFLSGKRKITRNQVANQSASHPKACSYLEQLGQFAFLINCGKGIMQTRTRKCYLTLFQEKSPFNEQMIPCRSQLLYSLMQDAHKLFQVAAMLILEQTGPNIPHGKYLLVFKTSSNISERRQQKNYHNSDLSNLEGRFSSCRKNSTCSGFSSLCKKTYRKEKLTLG